MAYNTQPCPPRFQIPKGVPPLSGGSTAQRTRALPRSEVKWNLAGSSLAPGLLLTSQSPSLLPLLRISLRESCITWSCGRGWSDLPCGVYPRLGTSCFLPPSPGTLKSL